MKQRMRFVSLLAAVLMLAACGAREGDPNGTSTGNTADSTATAAAETDTATATHPASPGGTALVPSVTSGTTVLVMLNDNSIAVREQNIPAGPAVLTVENRGTDVHNLFVEGQGISVAAGDPIAEGKSATMNVTFKPGNYVFYCPIADHRTRGEQVQITIAP
ncbi:MAG: hypothetical protein M3Q69_05665 [Acidobacteriota bacterium]|nr:hypothetical protein [Acidobacteriota bacterium]